MHSKGKLALAIFTSPGAAFEEILERRLLGTGLWIVAITGLLATLAVIGRASSFGPLQYFMLGKDNPISWFGLFLLYGLALQLLLKWLGTKTDLVKILTILGWSQLALLFAQTAATASGIMTMGSDPNITAIQTLEAIRFGFYAWYVVIIAFGLHKAFDIPLGRAAMSYLMIVTATIIGFSVTYGSSRLAPFHESTYAIQQAAKEVVSADVTPWAAAAVVGLVLGLWRLGQSLDWSKSLRIRAAAGAAIVGVFMLGYYVDTVMAVNNYGNVVKADRLTTEAEDVYQQSIAKGRTAYAEAAKQMERLIPVSKNNIMLFLDVADSYYLADKPEQSIKYYERFHSETKKANLRHSEGADENSAAARAYSSIGAVYYQQGEYDRALAEFDKAIKAWPKFRDPWIRKALTYDRMGEYDKAIEAGNHAVQKLGSESNVAWVALAQAFIQIDDAKQAGTAITMAKEKDNELAKKIGSNKDNWKNAIEKLTDQDLKYPLEKEPAPVPEKPKAKGKAGEKPGKK